MTAKKCKISSSSSRNLEKNWNLGSGPNVVLALESFTYYVSNVYVPRVRANAVKCLQHHQGYQETPKSADVICEWPLAALSYKTSLNLVEG